jgi:NAD(P)-dependent dehydrogenase (short-subunit alcohol dehydrogenase family)
LQPAHLFLRFVAPPSIHEKIMTRLANKLAIVTGAGAGLGKAIALRFAREGARVIAVTGSDSARQTVAEAQGAMEFVRCDVTDERQVIDLMQHCRQRHGRLDVLINNAGIGNRVQARVHETEPAEWDRVMNVNVRGAFLVLKHALSLMLDSGGGSIINMASIGSHRGTPYSSPYITSKGALLMLTRTAALEYAKDNIRINAVCPGVARTPLVEQQSQELQDMLRAEVPQGRLCEPDEVAALCVFLASDEAPHISGADYLIDGGRSAT